MKKILLLSIVLILLFSCEKQEIERERALPQISLEERSIPEDALCKRVKITLENPSDIDTQINLTSQHITTSENDYEPVNETITIPAGETLIYVVLNIHMDYYNESSESFVINGEVLTGNTNNSTFQGNIGIEEPDSIIPTIIVGDVTVSEGEPILTIPVGLSFPYNRDLNCFVELQGDFGDDIIESFVEFIIPAGEMLVNVEFSMIDDSSVEGTENFGFIAGSELGTVYFSHGYCGSGDPFNDYSDAVITIIDND